MFDNIFKRLEVWQKYSAARRILNSVLDVWKSAQHGLLFFIYYIDIMMTFSKQSLLSSNVTSSWSDNGISSIRVFRPGMASPLKAP